MNTTTQQPEPLRLADALENGSYLLSVERAATCAELRRLHAIEAEHIKLCRDYQDTWDSRDRLHAENQQLRADLEAIGAGGVGPLMPATVQHQHKSNIDNDLQRENGHLITSSSIVPAGWKLVPVEPTIGMCMAGDEVRVTVDDATRTPAIYRAMLDAAPQPPTPSRPEIDHAHELRRHSRKLGQPVGEAAGVMQRAADEIDRLRAALEQPVEQEPVAWQSIEAMAVQRYKVVPAHDSMFYRHAVVAGDGTQQLYIGRETECENIARRFAGAFLDGAYEASLYTQPQNLSCKSNQARLATLWGYVKEQPPRQPLTDEQWLKLWTGRTGQRLKPGPDRDRLLRRFRFAERAHGIGGAA